MVAMVRTAAPARSIVFATHRSFGPRSPSASRSVLPFLHGSRSWPTRRPTDKPQNVIYALRRNQTWNWVIGSPGQWVIWVIFHVRVTGSPDNHFDPVWDPSFFRFRKYAQNEKRTFEMLKWRKSLSGVWLLDWNHWISVRAINFYFYLWSLKTYWPEDTS